MPCTNEEENREGVSEMSQEEQLRELLRQCVQQQRMENSRNEDARDEPATRRSSSKMRLSQPGDVIDIGNVQSTRARATITFDYGALRVDRLLRTSAPCLSQGFSTGDSNSGSSS